MECPIHGVQKPTLVCQHLQHGYGLGFNLADEEPAADEPEFKTAWCNACDAVLAREGEWNDTSEGFSKPLFICAGCFETVKRRNLLQ